MERSSADFFTRHVLQRWARGEISTDTAAELIHANDSERIIGWNIALRDSPTSRERLFFREDVFPSDDRLMTNVALAAPS